MRYIHHLCYDYSMDQLLQYFIIITDMFVQSKRAKTPTRFTQPIPTRKTTSPLNATCFVETAHTNKQQAFIKNYRAKEENKTKADSLAMTIDRFKCESPALTACTTTGPTHQKHDQDHSKSDLETSLKIALELAEYHRRDAQNYKLKLDSYNENHEGTSGCKCSIAVEELKHKNQGLEREVEKCEDRFNKLKARYKQMKRERHSFVQPPSQEQDRKRASIQAQPNQLELEMQTKAKTIQRLCEQVADYEQNSQNMLKVVSILQQKMQELSMENSLLRGMLRERQVIENSSSISNSRCQPRRNNNDHDIRYSPNIRSQSRPSQLQERDLNMERHMPRNMEKPTQSNNVKLRRVYDADIDIAEQPPLWV